MGLVDKIKADVKKSGQNKGKFIYFREGSKQRIDMLDLCFRKLSLLGVPWWLSSK